MQRIQNFLARWRLRQRAAPWARVVDATPRRTDRMILAIMACAAAWVGFAYVLTEPVRLLNPYGFSYLAGAVLAALFACYAVARLAGRSDAFAAFGAALAVGVTLIIAGATIAVAVLRLTTGEITPTHLERIFAAGALAALIAIYVAIGRHLGVSRSPAIFLAAIPLGCLLLYSQLPLLQIWYSQPTTQTRWDKQRRINIEETYYNQYHQMRRALDGLKEQRPGITDLYFVGFAGDASQDVFLKEVRSVGKLFDERFDTKDRSLLLINNLATMKDVALANGNNLWHAVEQIGKIMDPEEDVLFLFLTSHGSKKELGVNFWPLGFNNLEAGELREMLDEARIKWRVIVVSACYSGSFIDELRTDHSLIITAAASDRKSFGCSNENDFTYFSRAYFDEALRNTFSFPDAFDEAARSIARREQSEGLIASQPQIDIGAAMRPKLEELQNRLGQLNKGQLADHGRWQSISPDPPPASGEAPSP